MTFTGAAGDGVPMPTTLEDAVEEILRLRTSLLRANLKWRDIFAEKYNLKKYLKNGHNAVCEDELATLKSKVRKLELELTLKAAGKDNSNG